MNCTSQARRRSVPLCEVQGERSETVASLMRSEDLDVVTELEQLPCL